MQVASCPELKSYVEAQSTGNDGDNEDDDDEEDEHETIEVRFVPQDKSLLDTIYKAMTECQRLHPDPVDQESEFDEEDEDEDVEDVNGDQPANGSNGQPANGSSTGDEPMDQ